VIGADGRNSVVARRLGLVSPHRLQRFALMTYIADGGGPRDRGQIFVDPPRYAILNPVAPDVSNLGIVVPLAWAGAARGRLEAFFEEQVRRLPHLAARLPRLTRVAPVRGIGPLAYRVASPRHCGVLLVGDAAGFYDPFTGEGIFTALRGAELAARAAVAALEGSPAALAGYERARRDAFADKARVTRALQVLIGRRWLANGAARLFLRRPAALDLVMGVIGDFVPPRALVGRPAVRALLRR
jgi:flavin-dependent dehydrogenase